MARRTAEKNFYAIDGTRTVGEIDGDHGQRDAACAFFERLWRYDRIVLDTSR